jgi:hypothetical protein
MSKSNESVGTIYTDSWTEHLSGLLEFALTSNDPLVVRKFLDKLAYLLTYGSGRRLAIRKDNLGRYEVHVSALDKNGKPFIYLVLAPHFLHGDSDRTIPVDWSVNS